MDEGADGRLAAAVNSGAQLELIGEGEPPMIFSSAGGRSAGSPSGWEPDHDDGVWLNIRPFMTAELRLGGRKGAGSLRAKLTARSRAGSPPPVQQTMRRLQRTAAVSADRSCSIASYKPTRSIGARTGARRVFAARASGSLTKMMSARLTGAAFPTG